MPRKKIHDALDRLAAEERKFLGAEFLAPVISGGRVGVRIAGVVCQMRVTPREFEGFGVFNAVSHSDAQLVREATMSERRKYLALFSARDADRKLSRPDDPRCRAGEPRGRAVPGAGRDPARACRGWRGGTVRHRRRPLRWQSVLVRPVDPRADPAAATYLRQSIVAMTDPKKLDRPGLLPGQHLAYLLNFTSG
jgi:hypothetical protein